MIFFLVFDEIDFLKLCFYDHLNQLAAGSLAGHLIGSFKHIETDKTIK